jgi:cell division protein ZapB
MLNEIQQLSEKIDALVAVVNQLRQENASLRKQSAQIMAEQREMQDRLTLAAKKVEALIDQLPTN